MVLDALTVWACSHGTYVMVNASSVPTFTPAYLDTITLVSVLMFLLFSGTVYKSWRLRSMGRMLRAIASSWLSTMAGLVLWLFLTKSAAEVSRLWFGTWVMASLLAISATRLMVYWALQVLRRHGYEPVRNFVCKA
jgi:FlaA1/EpsC-like NDP-sugar epimerase